MTDHIPHSAKRLARSARVGGLVALGLFLSACGITDDKGRPLTTLNPKGPQAEKIHHLLTPVVAVATVDAVVDFTALTDGAVQVSADGTSVAAFQWSPAHRTWAPSGRARRALQWLQRWAKA